MEKKKFFRKIDDCYEFNIFRESEIWLKVVFYIKMYFYVFGMVSFNFYLSKEIF